MYKKLPLHEIKYVLSQNTFFLIYYFCMRSTIHTQGIGSATTKRGARWVFFVGINFNLLFFFLRHLGLEHALDLHPSNHMSVIPDLFQWNGFMPIIPSLRHWKRVCAFSQVDVMGMVAPIERAVETSIFWFLGCLLIENLVRSWTIFWLLMAIYFPSQFLDEPKLLISFQIFIKILGWTQKLFFKILGRTRNKVCRDQFVLVEEKGQFLCYGFPSGLW